MLPGAVSYKLFAVWTSAKMKYDYRSFINIFMFSVVNYLLLAALLSFNDWIFFHWKHTPIPIRSNPLLILLSEDVNIDFSNLFWATIIGIFTSAVASVVINTNFISEIGLKIKITSFSGTSTTLEYFLSTKEQWIMLRDYKLDLVYSCCVKNYCYDNPPLVELLLSKVIVYNRDGNELYKLEQLFLVRNVTDICIEINPQSGGDENAT